MTRGDLSSDLPILFHLNPATGCLQSALNPQADPADLADLLRLLPPADAATLSETLARAGAAGFHLALRLTRPGGATLPVQIVGKPVKGSGAFLCVITDASAQTRATERFDLAAEAATEVLFLLDFDSGSHWWSPAFTRTFGHPPLSGPDPVADWFALVHPSDMARIRAGHAQARASGAEGWQDEYRFRRADGSYARVIDRARFFRRPDGSVARSISSLTDVTALRAAEDLFQETAEAAQDVIYSHDLTAGTLWLNDALHLCYGIDPQRFLQNPSAWAERIHPADRPGYQLVREQALRSAAPRFELAYRLRAADGQYRAVIDRARIRRDEVGRPLRVAGSIVDVTRQRDEAERLRAVVEVAANAVYEYDVAAGTFFYSEGMEKTFGHDWSDPLPAMTRWTSLLHPEERADISARFLDFIAGADRYARLEYRFRRGDGTWARVRERMIALRDETGAALRVIGGLEDVTAEHVAAERQRQSQKLEAIGKLTGGVAHDFNNLLTVIIGGAGFLEAEPALAEEARGLVRSIASAARRGAELTSGLLSFARQQPLSPRPLDMGAVFAEMDSLLRRTLPAYVTLETAAPPGLWLAEADPAQLNAALLNLAVNAAHAMPSGGRITMACRNWVVPGPTHEPEVPPGDFLRIDISDTGHGMPPEVASRAFDPFFTTKPLGKGSGLGLSMVWGFARQSGGHARIASEVGKGTTVTMFLPRSHSVAAETPALSSASLARGRGEHILVVEDEPLLRRFVVAMCEKLGYRVSEADHGEQALAVLRATPEIALLFTDVVMPGSLSGKDLADRALQGFPGLRVLLTSGYAENTVLQNGRLEEGVHFLAKPYELRDLAEKLRLVFAAHPLAVGLKAVPGQHSAAP